MPLIDVDLIEVGPRDGLQAEPISWPTEEKVRLITELVDVGLRRIEVASFVNPRRVPQMADAADVVAKLPRRPDVAYIGLVLNLRGAERAIASGLSEIGTALPATDGFGLRNQGQDSLTAVKEVTEIVRFGKEFGVRVQATMSMAFGCPIDGIVRVDRVVDLTKRIADSGIFELGLADTLGVAVPAQVSELFGRVSDAVPHLPLRAHFHDTRNTGIANAWAAISAGARAIDGSVAGLGGCPFAPGSSGNVATEDLAYLLQCSGVPTSIDVERLIKISRRVSGYLDRAPTSGLGRAGLSNGVCI